MMNSDGICMLSVDASVGKGCGDVIFYLNEGLNLMHLM